MNANEFARMVNLVISYIDYHKITKSIRELGFKVHCETWIRENESSDSFYVTLRIGLDSIPSSYMTVCDKGIKFAEPSIGKFELMDLYMKALKKLHKIAVGKKYGMDCYVPTTVIDTIMDQARLTGVPFNDLLNVYRRMGLRGGMTYLDESFKNNIIMEDTDMTYTLLNKQNSRRGMNYLTVVEPKKIHFNGPATIVEWNDGTKTVVKCQKGDTFDPLTGVAMCCMKKMLGTNESGSNYLNDVTKLIEEAWEAKNKRYKKANEKLRNCEKDK